MTVLMGFRQERRLIARVFLLVLGAALAWPAAAIAQSAPSSAAALLPRDLSPWGMFLSANIVVKGVIVGLGLASVVTWTIWLAKTIELLIAGRHARAGLDALRRAYGLASDAAALGEISGPVGHMIATALAEAELSAGLGTEGAKERVALTLSRQESRAGRLIARGTGILATVGATAPFVGLFGTVWGIMDSFVGISRTNTTNLAVVAPGIAEALLATAIGLVAAIPAVVIYNLFARQIAGYRAILGDASAEVLRHVSRDLDRGHANVAAGGRRHAPLRVSAE
ncbi:MAG: hypothetical protein NVSMB26_02680 [Beijerinckiaceae bacterium]